MDAARVLIVDDEADIRELLGMALTKMGLNTDAASTQAEAVDLLRERSYDLCLSDMRLPDGDGLRLLAHISKLHPSTPVAVITAYGSTENAVAALKAGAFDYLSKPVSLGQLRNLVKAALKLPRQGAGRKAEDPESAGGALALLGNSVPIRQVRDLIGKLARSQAPIYISGESGSGKELAAQLIHLQSARGDYPFVPVNCGAIPENLMESEFFGYRKGAFTGADRDRDGFFQAAQGGTLFLDEVAELPVSMQVKLLRAIQEKKVRKVGSTAEEGVDVRIISATHINLGEAVKNGRFRQDLYYRLNVIELKMPPLREMPEDIPVLAAAALGRHAATLSAEPPRISPEALQALGGYAFPGNVRELENILERAMALTSDSVIRVEDLQLAAQPEAAALPGGELPLQEYLEQVEKQKILAALERARHNKTAAAKLLGISFRALRYRMERLGIH